jgi:hypothetical protein
MRRRRCIPLLTLVLVVGSAAQRQSEAPADAGPKPDRRFQMTTTSISPGMRLSWGDGRLGDSFIDYKFTVEALTLNEWNDRFACSDQQVTIYGIQPEGCP